jgi:nicotinamidase-related amidase
MEREGSMKYCLIVIDMQKGIFSLKQRVENAPELMRNIQLALACARQHDIDIVFSQHANDTFLRPGSEGHALVDSLSVMPGDTVLAKTQPDILTGAGLAERLRERHITALIIAGLISNGCVQSACLSALAHGFDVVLLSDSHSTFYRQADKVVARVNGAMAAAGVRLLSTAELCEDLALP